MNRFRHIGVVLLVGMLASAPVLAQEALPGGWAVVEDLEADKKRSWTAHGFTFWIKQVKRLAPNEEYETGVLLGASLKGKDQIHQAVSASDDIDGFKGKSRSVLSSWLNKRAGIPEIKIGNGIIDFLKSELQNLVTAKKEKYLNFLTNQGSILTRFVDFLLKFNKKEDEAKRSAIDFVDKGVNVSEKSVPLPDKMLAVLKPKTESDPKAAQALFFSVLNAEAQAAVTQAENETARP